MEQPTFAMFSIRHASEIKKLLRPDATVLKSAYCYTGPTHLSFLITNCESLLVDRYEKEGGKDYQLLIPTRQLCDLCVDPAYNVLALLSQSHIWILPLQFVEYYDLVADYWVELITNPEPQDVLVSSKSHIRRGNKSKFVFTSPAFSRPGFTGKSADEDMAARIIMNTHVFKLNADRWKFLHCWEDTTTSRASRYLLCISESGAFQWISLDTYKEEAMLQLKLGVKSSILIQAGFLHESYLLVVDQRGDSWKMWLSSRNVTRCDFISNRRARCW